MKTTGTSLLSFGLLILCRRMASAQVPPLVIDPVMSRSQEVALYGRLSLDTVKGEPFSAVEESRYLRLESDGTFQPRSSVTTRFYRDEQGRTRAERYVTSYRSGKAIQSRLSSIYIADPVAGVVYRLDQTDHTALRSPFGAYADHSVANQNMRQAETISLGTQTMEGLTVEGTRQTLAEPVGISGNDREYEIALDTWFSSELKVLIFSQRDSSTVSRRTTRLTKIDRSVPDASLFQVPSDYPVEQAQSGAIETITRP